MIHAIILLLLFCWLFPSFVRFVVALFGFAMLCIAISVCAHACDDATMRSGQHYSIEELHQRAHEVAKFGSCVIADPNPPANARSTPGTDSRIVRRLDNMTEVTIAETRGNWVYVSGECDDQIGWVYRPLILCDH